MEDVYETASFLAKAGRPKADGVAAMAASGGGCVITLDKAEKYAVSMPPPAPQTRAILEANIPDFGSPNNPCDITAQVASNPESYRICAQAMLNDPSYAALVIMAPTITQGTIKQVPMFSTLGKEAGKPVCISWLSEWLQGPGSDLYEADPHTALFHTTSRCFQALAGWQWREGRRREGIFQKHESQDSEAAMTARKALGRAAQKITEREAKDILAAYAVPVARDAVVQTAAEAVRAAGKVGYPVVLKVESPDIPHKTEAGVVRLALKNEGAVQAAFVDIMEAAKRVRPLPDIRGVLVQPMIEAGVEIVIGTQCDATFGPMVIVGMGGVLVEVLRDSSAELAPVTKKQARSMLESLRGYKLLTGYRGSEPIDVEKLADIIVSVSHLATDLADEIAELDVNPIICSAGRLVAVDALIVRQEKSVQHS
jgi:acyl-CoA synthetase (NDP forming)